MSGGRKKYRKEDEQAPGPSRDAHNTDREKNISTNIVKVGCESRNRLMAPGGTGSGKGDPGLIFQLHRQSRNVAWTVKVRLVRIFFENRKLISSKELIHPVFYSKKGLASVSIKALSSRKDGRQSGLTAS